MTFEEKQIEEMAKIAFPIYNEISPHLLATAIFGNIHVCKPLENLYNAGYRKQEWISVEDRLPDRDGRYLVAMKSGNGFHISTRKFKRSDPPTWWKGHIYGYWSRQTGGVRFWAELPEPPKMRKEDEGKCQK